MTETFISVLPYILTFSVVAFIAATILKRNDLADVLWGAGIFFFSLLFAFQNEVTTIPTIVALVLVGVWAARIVTHIGTRFFSKAEEDFRYKTWRETWKYLYLRSYLQIFLLQTVLMTFLASIFLVPKTETISIFVYLGIATALFGLFFETVGDWQLKKFLEQKTGGIMKSGLWSTTRHPNYFGEVTFWWGIFIIFLPNFLYTLNPLFLLTPVTITILILKVSGIPMLEKKYEGNAEWEEYKKITPAFFPSIKSLVSEYKSALNFFTSVFIEFGSVVVFTFFAARFDFFTGVKAMLVVCFLSLLFSYWRDKRIPTFMIIGSIFIYVFGVLSLYFENPYIVVLELTLFNIFFCVAVVSYKLLLNKYLFKELFGTIFSISDKGWSIISYRWGVAFFLIAITNELVWHLAGEAVWIYFRLYLFVFLGFFGFYQFTVTKKHRLPDSSPFGLRL